MDPEELDSQAQAADDERRRLESAAADRRSELATEASDLDVQTNELEDQARSKRSEIKKPLRGFFTHNSWCAWQDSNLRPPAPQADALIH